MPTNPQKDDKAREMLEYYIEMFEEIPSGSHMVRAYTYMEEIYVNKFTEGKIVLDEKSLDRFDKLKSLALKNANINERRLAFKRSVETYIRMTNLEIKLPWEG